MSIGEIIFTILSADATLTTLLGASTSTAGMKKIFPLEAPQKESAPFVVYDQVSESPDHCAQGMKVRTPVVQITAWAATPDAANTIAERIVTLLDGATGSIAGSNVDNILLESISDNFEPDLDPPLFGRQIEVAIRISL